MHSFAFCEYMSLAGTGLVAFLFTSLFRLFKGRHRRKEITLVNYLSFECFLVFKKHLILFFCMDAKVPDPPVGHRWRKIRRNNRVTWLATWYSTGERKYIRLDSASKLKLKFSANL